MNLRVQGIPTEDHERLRAGGLDAYGESPVESVAAGGANPCRHCLGLIADGEAKLVVAYRPFKDLQPYAETGPIFLHRTACRRYDDTVLPAWFAFLDPAAIRGYDHQDWICYETGQVVRGSELASSSQAILDASDVAYVHIRSKFGCFQCRVDRN